MPDQLFELKEKSQPKIPKTKHSSSLYKYLLIFGLLILIGGITYCFIQDDDDDEVNVAFTDNIEAASNHYIKLGEYMVNLKNKNSDHYVKMVLVLKVENAQDALTIEEKMSKIRDVIQTFLKDLRVADFNGAAGTIRIKIGLLKRINNILKPQKVEEVLIQEFLIN